MLTAPPIDPIVLSAQALRLLLALPLEYAIGVCCAHLQRAAETRPEVVRRVLNEPIIKEGFLGTTLLAELQRAAR